MVGVLQYFLEVEEVEQIVAHLWLTQKTNAEELLLSVLDGFEDPLQSSCSHSLSHSDFSLVLFSDSLASAPVKLDL